MRRKGLIGECVELACLRVALDRGIELSRVESLEPGAKPRELSRGELFNGLLDVLGGGHAQDIALVEEARKSRIAAALDVPARKSVS